tara:strand:+ start:157 stop:564 length:408 start_codon:yes stop_codon:yes gene_type:complete
MISTSEPLMKIEFVEVQKPKCRSYGLFDEINPAKIIEDGKVSVIPEFVTKTRIHTSLFDGRAMKGINMEVDGIKTHRHVEYNHFHNQRQVQHLFVKSKKQDYEVYKRYVEGVVIEAMSLLGVEMDKLVVELEIWK